MKKGISLAGPIAGAIAFKCPFCLLAMAGLSAGLGSLVPILHGVYEVLIIGLGALFTGFLLRSWRRDSASRWMAALGALGFVGLIIQVTTEPGGIFAIFPAVALSGAAIWAFLSPKRSSSCCRQKIPSNRA